MISLRSAVGLNFSFDVVLPVPLSISYCVGGGGVLATVLSFERGLVFSGCVAGAMFAGVSCGFKVQSLLLAAGLWLVAVFVVVCAVVSSRGFLCGGRSLLGWLQWLVQ